MGRVLLYGIPAVVMLYALIDCLQTPRGLERTLSSPPSGIACDPDPQDIRASFVFGGSILNSLSALAPRMLRLASCDRNLRS